MRRSSALLLLVPLLLAPPSAAAAQRAAVPSRPGDLAVVRTVPAAIATAPVGTSIAIDFDRPVALGTLDARTFRVFGRQSGPKQGSLGFARGGRRVVFTPETPFAAGDAVSVNLSRGVRGLDGSSLRAAGYAFQFWTEVAPSAAAFTEYDVMSNRDCCQTRIYGASAVDLDHDGFPDLTTVNEVSADLRVFLNRGDGTGLYDDYLAPQPIGIEASPNDPGDFDGDGNADLCVSATSSDSVWIVLGNGDGTFASAQEVPVGGEPHGIQALDVDGDADLDVVNCNRSLSQLALVLNDGAGVFGAPSFFEGGVTGEYGLAAGDMDGDGITDLVAAGQGGAHVRTLLGNGDGTFAFAGPAVPSGGATWVVTLGDLDGDGDLDASTANSGTGTAGILENDGTGQLGSLATVNLGAHTVSTDLGDLDGDGDLDWLVSSFGGGFWRLYENDGSATFSFWSEIDAPANPSCAILLDTDGDLDLDLALTDEIADVVVLMRNE